ncbi:MAG TPA: ABC transporter ATP-binding protein [Christensenellaceae bacterium]|nr:ABC transporter ATP-binding protein [Christensenellaceae bacterium]
MQDKPLLSIRGLKKSFDTQDALRGLDLDVYKGEFLTLLGPSGCGKTTTLRIIAGLETPTEGKVYLEGVDITSFAPEKREVNTVFQNYALFPHMNVEKNIAYGLRTRRLDRKTIKQKVKEMLHLVQLEGYEKRMPSQLSGGQRQRVAIARSAVLEPKILLLDEPLGALDLQLRRQMQGELKRMQKQLGITFIYITHDQEEALNMSDRIALMRDGRFVQLASPYELYENPVSAFAASFIGETNLIEGTVSEINGDELLLDIGGKTVRAKNKDWVQEGQKLCLCIRAERLRYRRQDPGHNCLHGKLVATHYTGSDRTSILELSTGQTVISRHTTEQEEKVNQGETVCVWWDIDKATVVIDDREQAL